MHEVNAGEFNKESFRKRIKELRGSSTQEQFAEMVGVGHQLISDYETGRTKPTTEILSKFVNNAKINLTWLFTGKGEKFIKNEFVLSDKLVKYDTGKYKRIPIIGNISCGEPIQNWYDNTEHYYNVSDVNHFNSPFILIAKGDSMRPYINPNDKLIIADEPDRVKNGCAVVVSFKTEPESYEGNVKLIKFLDNDMVMLYSINTKYEPFITNKKNIYHIFKLVRIIREVK